MSLTDDEVYALTAYILAGNKIIGENETMVSDDLLFIRRSLELYGPVLRQSYDVDVTLRVDAIGDVSFRDIGRCLGRRSARLRDQVTMDYLRYFPLLRVDRPVGAGADQCADIVRPRHPRQPLVEDAGGDPLRDPERCVQDPALRRIDQSHREGFVSDLLCQGTSGDDGPLLGHPARLGRQHRPPPGPEDD